jgi:hypothetical protein
LAQELVKYWSVFFYKAATTWPGQSENE